MRFDFVWWFDFTMRPVRDARGSVVAIVPEAAETTAKLQAEEARRQSQKLDAMGQLTGGVAHDFNNLLTPIIGSLDMLERRGLPSERERRLVGAALQSAERAKTLVQRLLAFARRQPLQTAKAQPGDPHRDNGACGAASGALNFATAPCFSSPSGRTDGKATAVCVWWGRVG